jgi:Co/Zn/Cd efflux system component
VQDCCASKGHELERLAQQADQRRVLIIVLILNASMFVAEFVAGLIAGSAALMADSVDMLGDATVYGLSLYALSRSDRWKAGAAVAKGVFILILGLGVVAEILVKLRTGVAPVSTLMLVFGSLALVVNLYCLRLMWRFRALDVNMSSTVECSRNDAIANVGVIAAGAGVALTGSFWPDIAVAAVIAALFLRSAIRMLGQAWPMLRHAHG